VLFQIIMSLAFTVAVALLILNFSSRLLWFIPVGIIAMSYTLAIIPGNVASAQADNKWIRLRDIPYLKVFLIVGVVTYVTTYLPHLYMDSHPDLLSPDFTLVVMGRALFIFAITLPFDIRDLNFDRETKLKTIPGKIGVKGTKKISAFLLLGLITTEAARYFGYQSDGAISSALIVSAIIAIIFVRFSRPNGSEYFYSMALEGTMIIQFFLVVIARN